MLCFLQWIVGFVDDNSLNIKFREGQTVQEALQQAQTALSSWKRLLQITGGDLALEKCVYSFMGWVLAKGGETLGSISDFPGTIEILSKSRDTTVIKRIEAWEAERILGVRCGLDGKDDTELSYRLGEATTLAGRIKHAPLSRFDGWPQ